MSYIPCSFYQRHHKGGVTVCCDKNVCFKLSQGGKWEQFSTPTLKNQTSEQVFQVLNRNGLNMIKKIANCYLRQTTKGDFEKSVTGVLRMIGFKLCKEITRGNETF